MMKKCGLVIIVLFIVGNSCKYPFEAELRSGEAGQLVVDGYVNVGTDAVTNITLSRTTPVNDDTQFVAEQGAQVFIEDEDNNSFPLSEISPGHYRSDSLTLSQTKSYRLKILSNEKVYFSEFTETIITPEIDSVSWKELPGGVEIYVSTHDPENKTKYYQWNYSEVWEQTVPYVSYYKFENNQLLNRSVAEIQNMQLCWKYFTGLDINTKSSAKYPEDIIPMNKVKLIPRFDERLYIRYNITVSQHALSKAAFSFYEILTKNGSLGSFSDPMPSELPGNLYCLDAAEPIIGYIGAYTTQTKRLEILEQQIQPGWIVPPSCYVIDPYTPIDKIGVISHTFLPVDIVIDINTNTILGAFMAPAYCADCRANGGTNLRPSFWPE